MINKIVCTILIVMMCLGIAQAQNSIGKKIIKKYDRVRLYQFEEHNYCEVQLKGKLGVIDKNGKEVVPCKYDDTRFFQLKEGDSCRVKLNGKWGLVEKGGKEIIPCKYDDFRSYQFKDGNYCEVQLNGKWGVVDKNGNEVVHCKYDNTRIYQLNEGDYCEVQLNGKWGVVDKGGKEILPCKYDNLRSFWFKDGNYCEVQLNGKWGAADKSGKEVILCKYDDIRSYQLNNINYCEVQLNNKWGVSDRNGKEVIPCKYDEIKIYQFKYGNYCMVKLDGKWGVVDNNGKEVLPIGKYEHFNIDLNININNGQYVGHVGQYVQISKESVFKYDKYDINIEEIIKNGKWGIYDLETSKEVVPCQYDYVDSEQDGIFAFNQGGHYDNNKISDIKGGKWGFFDTTGKEIIPAQYDAVTRFEDGVAQVTKDGVVSMLAHPLKGASVQMANGADITVDNNIPQTNKNNENSFAFVIANENYNHLTGADYAINDGKIFASYCQKTLGIPEKNIRYYEDATYGNIVGAMKKIQDIADVYEGDATIIFYFSGLGATDSQSMEKYLLATDASLIALQSTGFSVRELMNVLSNLNTVYTWVVLDAPFSNVDKNGKPLVSERSVAIKPKNVSPKGNVILSMASAETQTAYADKKLGHSLFTYGLLEKLQQTKGTCTLKEMTDHASQWTKKSSLSTFDKIQEPVTSVSAAMSNKWNSLKF